MRHSSPYASSGAQPAPAVELALQDPARQRNLKLTARVDTGFSGSLLVGLQQYLELGLALYEEPEKAVSGRLATGLAVPLRASRGVATIGSEAFECAVYTTPFLVSPLLGRDLLNLWRTTLDGPKRLVELEG